MSIHSYIDHTILKPNTLSADVEKLCSEAVKYDFASVCVPPPFVKLAKQLVKESTVKVATVIGFPFGYSATESKIAEIILAMLDGADELDMVVNLLAIKNGDWVYLADEINHVLPVVKSKHKVIKLIIETGILTDEEIIKCCQLYGPSGIDFLKTSTGFAERGATVQSVELMRKHLPQHVKIKASGGIKDYAFAMQLIKAGAERLGCSSSVAIVSGQAS